MKLKDLLHKGIVHSTDEGEVPGYSQEDIAPVAEPSAPVDDTPAWAKAILDENRSLRGEIETFRSEVAQYRQPQAPQEPQDFSSQEQWDEWQKPVLDHMNTVVDKRITESQKNQMGMMDALLRNVTETQVVQQVAGGLGQEAQSFVREQLKGLDTFQIANLAQNPQVLNLLTRAAKLEHMEKTPKNVQAPSSSSVFNPSVTLSAAEQAEIDRAYNAYKDLGITREEVTELLLNGGF